MTKGKQSNKDHTKQTKLEKHVLQTEQALNNKLVSETAMQAEQIEKTEQSVSASENFVESNSADRILINTAKSEENSQFSNIKHEANSVESNLEVVTEKAETPLEKQKSGGKAIAILALLVAFAGGGAGHFLVNKKFEQVEKEIARLSSDVEQGGVLKPEIDLPNFDKEKALLDNLDKAYQVAVKRVEQLEKQQQDYQEQIQQLHSQVKKLAGKLSNESSQWLLLDSEFLLKNALRKLVLDSDTETAKSLLIEADNVLNQVGDVEIVKVRDAIKADLHTLTHLNEVDQNDLMQRLSQLANAVDDMPLMDSTDNMDDLESELSGSIADWEKNITKSANSFLNSFIRISDKNNLTDKVFIAPNQEIYLRENIRLRLQIAILTISRQQNDLYKGSLEAVSAWVRSYFDTQNENVKSFIAELDSLLEQSIYIDAPNQLQSLAVLAEIQNKPLIEVEKIQLESNKSLEHLKLDEKVFQKKADVMTEPEVKTGTKVDVEAEPKQAGMSKEVEVKVNSEEVNSSKVLEVNSPEDSTTSATEPALMGSEAESKSQPAKTE
ncbi:uroporphyrin-3 C-methyltransferase [Nicoletella semolina]|uniref:Uroporphyrin-3 C-methyltransferase n=1 Tax=Nicoletella semolina TaxID=271160 RepID=A0A4R2NCI0_9PAST|nr:uroporphyrinogen-III C-methyltransferase [Nicoletella semolina]MDH2924202.1 hypothetical protein [Nicoletella semolina]TCP18901.1 uroporphyrin-3 C-methyltransferase [Nicoletella semolina]